MISDISKLTKSQMEYYNNIENAKVTLAFILNKWATENKLISGDADRIVEIVLAEARYNRLLKFIEVGVEDNLDHS